MYPPRKDMGRYNGNTQSLLSQYMIGRPPRDLGKALIRRIRRFEWDCGKLRPEDTSCVAFIPEFIEEGRRYGGRSEWDYGQGRLGDTSCLVFIPAAFRC